MHDVITHLRDGVKHFRYADRVNTDLAPDPVPDTVPRALGRLRVALEDSFARASRELGMTAQQAELLCAAMRPGPIGDLAQVLRCDRSNVSRLVERARARGWVDRCSGETDGRVSVITLTPQGDNLARRFIASLEDQLAPLLQVWPAERNQTAIELITEITDSLEAARDHNARRRPAPRPQATERTAAATTRR